MATSEDFIKKYLGVSPDYEKQTTPQKSTQTAGGGIADSFISKYNATVDDSYISSFISDWNDYAKKAETAYKGLNWESATSGSLDYLDDDGRDLYLRSTLVRSYLDTHKDDIEEEQYKGLVSQLDEMDKFQSDFRKGLSDAKQYYSQWKSQEDYDDFVAYQKDYDEKKNLDIDAALKEIEDWETAMDQYGNAGSIYWQDYFATEADRQAAIDKYNSYIKQYGSEKEMTSAISARRAYIETAKRLQEGIRLASVTENDDFQANIGYVSTEVDSGWDKLGSEYGMGYGDMTYEYINGDKEFRDEVKRKHTVYSSGKGESRYEELGYDHMSKDEIAIYNYYYTKEGKEAAEKYLDSIQESLNHRKGTTMFEGMEDNTLLELAFGVAAGLDQFESGMHGLWNAVTGNDEYIPPSATQMASGMVRKDLADNSIPLWYNFKEGQWEDKVLGNSLGQIAYDTTTTTTNMLPSILTSVAVNFVAPGAGAAVGSVLLGSSAAGNAYQEMVNLGYDKGQARTYAALVGGSEAGLQYLLGGISNLGGKLSGNAVGKIISGIDNAFARTAIKLGGSMLSEGIEEGLQEVLNPWFQNLVFHMDKDVNWNEVAYSSLLGALTAGFMEGGGIVATEVGHYKTGKALQKADISAQRLAEIGNTFSADTVAHQLAGRVDENTGAYTMGRLFNEIGATLTEQNVNDITQALVAKGMDSETARKNAEAMAMVVEGGNLSDLQVRIIESNDVLAEAVRTTIIDSNATWYQRSKGYNEALMALAREKTAPKASRTNPAEQGEENAPATDKVDTQNENGSETLPEAEADTSPAKVKSISSVKDKTIKLEDGSEVSVKDADLSPDDGVRIETITSIEGISEEDANFVLNTLRAVTGASAQIDSLGAKEAYKYGFYGFSQDHMTKHGVFANSLTESQRQAIYQAGQKARQKQAEEKTPKTSKGTSKQTGIYFDAGNGNVVEFRDSNKALTDKQSAGVKAAMLLKKLGIGGDIYFFESYRNSSGQLVYKDNNGNEVKAPNGWYEKDGSIHIDLNAGARGNGVVLFTLAHELTHFIEQWSPKKYKILADFLIENYEKGHSMDKLVRAKQEHLSNLRGKEVSYQEAYSEVIADSMEAMLADGNVMEKLIELKAKDNSLFMKMKQFFDNLLNKIRNIYKGQTPDSAEGRAVMEMTDSIEKIQQLFAEALMDAGENYQMAEKNSTDDGGVNREAAIKRSDRIVDQIRMHLSEIMALDSVYTIDSSNATHYTGVLKDDENLGRDVFKAQGGYAERSGFGRVVLGKKGIVSTVFHGNGPAKQAVFPAIKAVIEQGIEIGKDYNHNGKGFDTVTFAAPIDFFGTKAPLGVVVKVSVNGRGDKSFYIHEICDAEGNYIQLEDGIPTKKEISNTGLVDSSSTADVADDGISPETSIHNENGIVKNESAEAMDVEVDAKTESVAPTILKSERTWTESDYVQEREKAAKEIAKAIGVSVKKAKAYIDSVNSIAKMIAEDRVRLDYFSSPGRSSFVSNVEYGGSFDFSTLCKKRRLLTGTFTAIQKALPNTALTADEILKIRNRMKEKGLEVSCGLCYVEGSRANMGQFAKEFLNLYKQYYPDAWQPNMADVNTPDGIEWVRINHPECYEQYEYFWNHYGTLKPGDKNLFASQQKPKLYQLHTEYKGEVLDKFNDDDNVEEKNLNGGIRLQSFSDFEIVHLIDTMQIIMDMSRVGLAGQAYTKVPDFAWALGDTGLKINLSLIAKGVDENGKLIFDDVEGMPIETAVALRNRYSKNVGTILVAFNDEQLLAAMADERVDFIIPFHRSQWKKSQYAAMGLPAKTKDYTYMQNEKFIKPQYHEYRGRLVKDKATNYMPNEYWDFSKSGKENAEAYLEMCARNNKRPKFYKLLQNNGDGSYSLKADGSTDGYWKLLIDFKMYDNDGNGSPQMPVTPDFNMEEATRMLNEYSGGHSNFPVAQGIVDEFVQEYKDRHEGVKFSDRDSDGKQLTEDQLEFFEESKVRDEQGRLMVLYHGSKSEAFTEFDISQGVWLTPIQSYAEVYAKMWHTWRDDMDGAKRDDINGLEPSVYADPDYRLYRMYANIKNPADIGELNQDITDAVILRLAKAIGVEYSEVKAMAANYEGFWVYEMTRTEEFINLAHQQGFDGFKATENGKETWCAFSAPNQVKLTTNEVPSGFYDIRYSDRDNGSVSNRSLLANAFEGVAQNDSERNKIQEYKDKIDLIEAEERKLSELNERIKALSFAKGPRDTKAIRGLQFEARQAANRINTYDKQLLRLEASKPLQDVLAREKRQAYLRAEKKGKEALEAYREKAAKTQRELLERWQASRKKGVESRRKTALRHKIKDVVGELNQYLLRGTRERHVPIGLQRAVAEALNAVNMDTVGAEERIAKLEAELLKAKTPEAIREISRKIDNIREMGERMDERLKKLKTAYDEFINSDDPLIANSHDDGMSDHLMTLIVRVGDTPLRDMTLSQLQDVYDVYKIVLATIRNANKSFKDAKNRAISTRANQVMAEIDSLGVKRGKRPAFMNWIEKFGWDNLKPVYAIEHIGSEGLIDAFNNVRAGEDTWARNITEAREYYLEKSKKYKYDSWDFEKQFKFKSTSGMDFELTLDQIMSLYAYSKRDQAADHLKYGGIVFDPKTEVVVKTKSGIKVKYNVADATSYNISEETLADIISQLTDEQKSFVDEMQAYLSDVMGAKGNEVSLAMYGVKLFREKSYFPLKSAHQYMAKAKEQAMGDVKIKNAGFSKETKPHAKNPIVLSSFMDVWASHVNEMSMYHAFVLPMEDFYRIYNYTTPSNNENLPVEGVNPSIENAYGSGATGYIEQMLKDLNGGARTDSTTGFINKMIGLFKKGSVFASLSVTVQQPSAIARATALVDTKYFIGPKIDHKRHKALWEEVKRYAPVAIIKEMGYFDTSMGKSTQDFILSKEYSGFKEKMAALVKDSGYRDEILSKAPALADELAWCSIWEAVKRETKANNPGMDVKSEEFLKKAGERFTEVITKTQVYDSVLSRSAMMRSKDTGMKMATAFMAEPTTSINMIADALLKGKRGSKKYARKAIGAVIASQILNSILVSFVYAGRDDDEDETYVEKYIGTLTGEMLDSLNPATYIPFIKDIVSIVQGYDVERSDMAVISDLWKAWENLSNDKVSAYRKVEGFAGSVAQIFGLPVKNIMRDARGIYQTIESFVNGQQTTGAGIANAIRSAVTGKDVSNQNQLYEAYLSGDQTQIARVKSRFKEQAYVNSAIRKALRENDPRIKEAAEAKANGDLDEYLRLAKEIIAEKHFVQDDVVAAINAEINALDKGEETTSAPKASGMFKADDFAVAISQGDDAMANTIKSDIIKTAQKNGKTAEEAEKSFISSATSSCKEMFDAGDMTESQAINALTNFCGKTEEEAEAKVQYWEFKQDYPDVYVDDAWIDEYSEEVESSGISIEVFVDYRNQVKDITGENKKERRMAVIDSMPISSSQKDALYYAEGWTESKLYEAPWH